MKQTRRNGKKDNDNDYTKGREYTNLNFKYESEYMHFIF